MASMIFQVERKKHAQKTINPRQRVIAETGDTELVEQANEWGEIEQ
jgi:hypothetical protein